MAPPFFENFSLVSLNSEQNPSPKKKKKRSTGPARNRSTGVDFEIYRSGRVEKILTSSIFGPHCILAIDLVNLEA